jgi:hypothetical protein
VNCGCQQKVQKDDFLMITHVFASLPKEEHKMHTSKHADNIADLIIKAVKKTVRTHWKRFVKGDQDAEKTEDVFHGEGTKTLCAGPKSKNHQTPKKWFKGACQKCGKLGHKTADCQSRGGDEKGDGGGNKNKDVTCCGCNKKGHCARDCPNKKKNDHGLFCGMIYQEGLDKTKEEEEDAGLGEWSFVGMAALIASNSDAEESDDDLCPSLLARNAVNNKSQGKDGDSIPELMGRKHCKSDSDDESKVDKDGDSIPGLIKRNSDDSDLDDESKDDDSVPGLMFGRDCCNSDSDAEPKVREEAAVCNLSEDASCRDNVWRVAGPEFGSDSGCAMVVVRTSHGLKSSGASWRAV